MGQQAKGRRRGIRYGEGFASQGWSSEGIGLTGYEYGRDRGVGISRVKAVEEVLWHRGYETNGLGREGNIVKGYKVRGRYRRVIPNALNQEQAAVDRVARTYQQRRGVRVVVELTDRATVPLKVMPNRTFGRTGVARRMRSRELVRKRQGTSGRRREVRQSKVRVRRLESSGLGHIQTLRKVGSRLSKRLSSKGNKHSLVRGYKVTVKGPANGSLRSKCRRLGNGVRPRSTKMAQLGLAYEQAKTTVGTRGVTVECCYKR